MDAQIKQVLAELEVWGRENDESTAERSKKMLNLEPDTAQLLSVLIQSSQRKRLLEIGTSNGYSTIWLAYAARQTGGKVISVEHNPDKIALADANLRRVGLRAQVELRQGDATQIVAELPGPFDFVFLDADRLTYPALFDLLLPKLSPGALVLADNVHSHPQEIAGYLTVLASHPEFEHVVVGVGKGLSIAYRPS